MMLEDRLGVGVPWSGSNDAARQNLRCLAKGQLCFRPPSSCALHVHSFRQAIMRVLSTFVSSLLLSGAATVSAASAWTFEDATVSIASKGAEPSKDK